MAPIKAVKSCMKRKHFLHGIIFSVLTCSILCFCFCSFWFPSMEGLVLSNLPEVKNSIANANCLFVVVNLIIVILVGESRFGGWRLSKIKPSPDSSSSYDVYEVYVERRRRIRRGSENFSVSVAAVLEEKERAGKVEPIVEEAEESREDGEEEEGGLEKDELNRKVEEFIARVNEQRWIEARTAFMPPL